MNEQETGNVLEFMGGCLAVVIVLLFVAYLIISDSWIRLN